MSGQVAIATAAILVQFVGHVAAGYVTSLRKLSGNASRTLTYEYCKEGQQRSAPKSPHPFGLRPKSASAALLTAANIPDMGGAERLAYAFLARSGRLGMPWTRSKRR